MLDQITRSAPSRQSGRGESDRRTTAAPRRGSEPPTVRRRIAAFLLDTALVVGVSSAFASLFGSGSDSDSDSGSGRVGRVAITTILAGTLGFAYHVVLEGRFGQTAGKRACGIAVKRSNGSPCSYTAATLRTAGRFVDALPIGYLAGLASIVFTERDQRLGDRLADTVVVRTGESSDRRGRTDN